MPPVMEPQSLSLLFWLILVLFTFLFLALIFISKNYFATRNKSLDNNTNAITELNKTLVALEIYLRERLLKIENRLDLLEQKKIFESWQKGSKE